MKFINVPPHNQTRIELDGNELAFAIRLYIYAQGVHYDGASTSHVQSRDEVSPGLCQYADLLVEGRVLQNGEVVNKEDREEDPVSDQELRDLKNMLENGAGRFGAISVPAREALLTLTQYARDPHLRVSARRALADILTELHDEEVSYRNRVDGYIERTMNENGL